MSLRRFGTSGIKVEGKLDKDRHVKKSNVEPSYFALVDSKMQFVKTKHGQVVVYSNRQAANEACRRRGWPANIGMGEEKWSWFTNDYIYVLDPSLVIVPKSNSMSRVIFLAITLLGVVFLMVMFLKYSNLFDQLAEFMGSLGS